MFVPSIFKNDFFDEMFRFPLESQRAVTYFMNTDVKDMGNNYELTIELPGFDKEDIKAELKNGYLNISAEHTHSKEDKDEEGNFIRKERYSGKCQRSFFVGEHLTEEDIKGKFEKGVLVLEVPKEDKKPQIEEKKYITIQ